MKRVILPEQNETVSTKEAHRNYIYIAINRNNKKDILLLQLRETGRYWVPVKYTSGFNESGAQKYYSISEALESLINDDFSVFQFDGYVEAFDYILSWLEKLNV